MSEITIKKIYDDLPIIVKADDDKIYQLNYYDRSGKFRRCKLLEPKEHNGSLYYRIDGIRYSEYKLLSMERKCIKRINLAKKTIQWR
jgi:hypothetical protein